MKKQLARKKLPNDVEMDTWGALPYAASDWIRRRSDSKATLQGSNAPRDPHQPYLLEKREIQQEIMADDKECYKNFLLIDSSVKKFCMVVSFCCGPQ